MSSDWKPRTPLVHAGTKRSQFGELSEALFLTQGFAYDSAEQAEARFIDCPEGEFIYARYGNPTVRMFEERIAELEGTEDAFATASGMAAVNAALVSGLKSGDHVVGSRALFGSCHYILQDILPRFGVEVDLVDGTDIAAWKSAVRDDTKLVFVEGISNPTLEVIDIRAVADIAHAKGALLLVDNVFATPVLQRTLDLGADVVIYSTTKHIDGQGRCLGGVVCGSRDFIRGTVEPYLKHTGGSMSPFNAWVMLKGLETLDLRVQAQTRSAEAIAVALLGHEKLSQVIFPGLAEHPQHALAKAQMSAAGTMLSIDLKGGKGAAFKFLNALKIFTISNNLGDAKSLVTHPATTTHQRLTDAQRAELRIGDGLVRVSVGIEDRDDLIGDLLAALAAV